MTRTFTPLAALLATLLLSLAAACRSPTDNGAGGGPPSPNPPVPPPSDPCAAVAPTGRLTYSSGDRSYHYTTSDGGSIEIRASRAVVIRHTGYAGFRIDLWGTSVVGADTVLHAHHEDLNGKPIKDRLGAVRTIIFPGGAKVTMVSDGEGARLNTATIYDGDQSHRVDFRCAAPGRLIHSSVARADATRLDAAEADGETSNFVFDANGLVFQTLYMELTPGNRQETPYRLGMLDRTNPNHVADLYDDPRLPHT